MAVLQTAVQGLATQPDCCQHLMQHTLWQRLTPARARRSRRNILEAAAVPLRGTQVGQVLNKGALAAARPDSPDPVTLLCAGMGPMRLAAGSAMQRASAGADMHEALRPFIPLPWACAAALIPSCTPAASTAVGQTPGPHDSALCRQPVC